MFRAKCVTYFDTDFFSVFSPVARRVPFITNAKKSLFEYRTKKESMLRSFTKRNDTILAFVLLVFPIYSNEQHSLLIAHVKFPKNSVLKFR